MPHGSFVHILLDRALFGGPPSFEHFFCSSTFWSAFHGSRLLKPFCMRSAIQGQFGMLSDPIRTKNSKAFGPIRTPNWDAFGPHSDLKFRSFGIVRTPNWDAFGHIRTPFGPQIEMHSDPARVLIRMHSDSNCGCLDSDPMDLFRPLIRNHFRSISEHFLHILGKPTPQTGRKKSTNRAQKSANGRNFKKCSVSLYVPYVSCMCFPYLIRRLSEQSCSMFQARMYA